MLGNREYTTEEIVQGALENKRLYQRLLYDKYASVMYGICLNYARNREDAKEILQQGFIKVFRNLDQYKTGRSLEGWIRRIITNTAIDHYRNRQRKNEIISHEASPDERHFSEDILDKLQADYLIEYTQRLPDGARLIFNLYTIEGYNHREISKKLKISVGTSKSQLNRAKTLLKKWILDEMK